MVCWMVECENGVDLIGNSGNLLLQGCDKVFVGVIFDMVLSLIIVSSLDFGYSVFGQLLDVIVLYQKCVEQVGFVVFKLLDIFLILVEIGFILNCGDCCWLMDECYCQCLVEVIFVGVQGYFW